MDERYTQLILDQPWMRSMPEFEFMEYIEMKGRKLASAAVVAKFGHPCDLELVSTGYDYGHNQNDRDAGYFVTTWKVV